MHEYKDMIINAQFGIIYNWYNLLLLELYSLGLV